MRRCEILILILAIFNKAIVALPTPQNYTNSDPMNNSETSGSSFASSSIEENSNTSNYEVVDDYIPALQPRITTKALNLEIREGESLKLYCRGEHLQHFSRLWHKGSKWSDILANGEVTVTNDKRFCLTDKFTALAIYNVTRMDAGKYTCTILQPNTDIIIEVTHSLRVLEFDMEFKTTEEKQSGAKEKAKSLRNNEGNGFYKRTLRDRTRFDPNGQTRANGTQPTWIIALILISIILTIGIVISISVFYLN